MKNRQLIPPNPLNAHELENQVLTRLVIRCFIEEGDQNNPRSEVKTTIVVFNHQVDNDTNHFFTQLVCTDVQNISGKRESYKSLVGFELNYLPDEKETRLAALSTILYRWRSEIPLWLSPKEVVVCKRSGGFTTLLSPKSFGFIQHCARLETRLAYEMVVQDPRRRSHNPWVLGGIFYRLNGFVHDCNRSWSDVTGVSI